MIFTKVTYLGYISNSLIFNITCIDNIEKKNVEVIPLTDLTAINLLSYMM